MAASQVISLGIGSPSSIEWFLTFGLGAAEVTLTPEAGLTLYALNRNEALFPLQGYDGIETLRGLDQDQTLSPLEAH